MNSKLTRHLVVGLFAIAVLFAAYEWFKGFSQDPDLGTARTSGYVAAIEYLPEGAQVVLFKEDGTKIPSPDYVKGATDRDPAWRPDGHRLFFASDREPQVVNIYRWNPATNKIEKRSLGRRGKGNIVFGPPGYQEPVATAIITSGGIVLSYNPKDGSTKQLLPPVEEERSDTEEGGSAGQFEALYERIGQSFREARWGQGRNSIVAVMRRDGGEVLVVQRMGFVKAEDGSSRILPPSVVAAGDRIDFDVSSDGRVAVAVLGFQFPDRNNIPPQFVKKGVATPPYRHALIAFDPDKPEEGLTTLALSPNDQGAMAKPRFSPDGQELLVLLGSFGDTGQFTAEQLARLPVKEGGVREGSSVVMGNVLEAEWHPKGEKIVFVKRDGRRALFTVDRDGSNEKRLSGDQGDFGSPRFSPQTAP